MSFLPQDYTPPKAVSIYMKLNPGPNRFRVVGSFGSKPPTGIMGWLAWKQNEDGGRKPIRFRMADCPPKGSFDEEPKHFWAFTVINLTMDNTFQILELVQKSILDELNSLFAGDDWGNPSGEDGYDIEIFRVGEGKDTKYTTNPKPKAPMPEGMADLIRPVDLDKLFLGEDPFEFELKAEDDEEEGPGF